MAPIDRFKDSDYVNWLKVGQALLCTKEGIHKFCENKINAYHKKLLRKFPKLPCSGRCSAAKLCTVCGNRRKEWKDDILKQLTPDAKACWKNTDRSKWETDVWEIAKLFMGPGQQKCRASAADTDPVGLLQLVLNCELFTSSISNNLESFENVRQIRNNMFHSANFKVTTADMKDHVKAMITLLEGPTQLKSDDDAKKAVKELRKIEALPLEVNDTNVLQQEQTLLKLSIESLREDQTLTRMQLQKEIDSLRTHLDNIAEELKDSQAQHDELAARFIYWKLRNGVAKGFRRLLGFTAFLIPLLAVGIIVWKSGRPHDSEEEHADNNIMIINNCLIAFAIIQPFRLLLSMRSKGFRWFLDLAAFIELLLAVGIIVWKFGHPDDSQEKHPDNIVFVSVSLIAFATIQLFWLLNSIRSKGFRKLLGFAVFLISLLAVGIIVWTSGRPHDSEEEHADTIMVIVNISLIVVAITHLCRLLISTHSKELLKKLLRDKYNNSEMHEALDNRFVELRLQKFQLEALPDTLISRNVEELEKCRQSSAVVPLLDLFKKMGDDVVVPKKVLIHGRSGVGKTTVLEYIAREWAANKLWYEVDYLFLVKVREFSQNDKWSLSDMLFGDLCMSETDKMVAFDEIRKHSDHVMVLVDSLDEYSSYEYRKARCPIGNKVTLSEMISSIISLSFLPNAKIIVTSRPTNQIPSNEFDRLVDVYGFTREGINQYVNRFCAGNKELEQFISANINTNPNMATFCHTPVQCRFVCNSLEDLFEHSERGRVSEIQTMTQLYVKATHRLARKLHPQLKGNKTNMDLKRIFSVLRDPFLKHAKLAKTNCMADPLKLICYDDDLEKLGFKDFDSNTGFLVCSKKPDPDDTETNRNSWSFSHLTLQEFFTALGLLKGPRSGVRKVYENNASVKKYDIVITFIAGLMGDPRNAYYLEHLNVTRVSLDTCKIFIRQLKKKLENDPLKILTVVFETQRKELVDNLPEEFKSSTIYQMEMLSLCWAIAQDTCPITSIDLTECRLDTRLVKQLCEALEHNLTIKKLILNFTELASEETGRSLGAALHSMSQLRELGMWGCNLSSVSWIHIAPKCTRLQRLHLGANTVFQKKPAGRSLRNALNSMESLCELNLASCRFNLASWKHVICGISRVWTLMTRLVLNGNAVLKKEDAARMLGKELKSMPTLCELQVSDCSLTDKSWSAIFEGLTNCDQMKLLICQNNLLGDSSATTFDTLMNQGCKVNVQGCRLSPGVVDQLKLIPNRFIWRTVE